MDLILRLMHLKVLLLLTCTYKYVPIKVCVCGAVLESFQSPPIIKLVFYFDVSPKPARFCDSWCL